MTQKAIHIHEAYNSSLRDHKIIHEKENLSDIEKMLHMSKESILVEDFNLHHFTWEELFYSRQHLLLNELIKIITNIDASLALSQDTIMRDYQESQMTINLIFMTDDIMNWLIWCEINEEMKNFSDHLLIQTIIDFRVCKESARKSRCNWKIMNKLIVKSSFDINLLTQLKYSVSIFWLNLNTRFQHSDSIWYWSWIDTRFEFSTRLVKKSNMTSRELNIEIFPVFRLCITFLHYLFGRKS